MNNTEVFADPAATLILTRPNAELDNSFEVLLLKRSQDTGFAAGCWVFPGGRIDEADFEGQQAPVSADDDDLNPAIRVAALRETLEECGVDAAQQTLTYFAHWTTPVESAKRYSTWYFIADMPEQQSITIDQHEIVDYCWLTPQAALDQHWAGELQFTPPTFITLAELADIDGSAELGEYITQRQPPVILPQLLERDHGQQLLLCVDSRSKEGEETWRQRALVRHEKGMRVEFKHPQ